MSITRRQFWTGAAVTIPTVGFGIIGQEIGGNIGTYSISSEFMATATKPYTTAEQAQKDTEQLDEIATRANKRRRVGKTAGAVIGGTMGATIGATVLNIMKFVK